MAACGECSGTGKLEASYVYEGEEFIDESLALADLLRDEVVFCNTRRFDPAWDDKPSGKTEGPTVVLFVIANDVFYWACSDAESFRCADIGPLWKAHMADKKWGVIKWLCSKRGMRPQVPIVADMRAAGAWTDELEALPAPEPS